MTVCTISLMPKKMREVYQVRATRFATFRAFAFDRRGSVFSEDYRTYARMELPCHTLGGRCVS